MQVYRAVKWLHSGFCLWEDLLDGFEVFGAVVVPERVFGGAESALHFSGLVHLGDTVGHVV